MFFGWRGAFCGSTHGLRCRSKRQVSRLDLVGPLFGRHLIGPPHRAASRPHAPASSTHNSSSNPQTRQYASLPIGAARRAPRTPRNTKPQGHTAKHPSATDKSHLRRARLAAESREKSCGQPAAAVAARARAHPHSTLTVPRRTLASQPPRGRRDARSVHRENPARARRDPSL